MPRHAVRQLLLLRAGADRVQLNRSQRQPAEANSGHTQALFVSPTRGSHPIRTLDLDPTEALPQNHGNADCGLG